MSHNRSLCGATVLRPLHHIARLCVRATCPQPANPRAARLARSPLPPGRAAGRLNAHIGGACPPRVGAPVRGYRALTACRPPGPAQPRPWRDRLVPLRRHVPPGLPPPRPRPLARPGPGTTTRAGRLVRIVTAMRRPMRTSPAEWPRGASFATPGGLRISQTRNATRRQHAKFATANFAQPWVTANFANAKLADANFAGRLPRLPGANLRTSHPRVLANFANANFANR